MSSFKIVLLSGVALVSIFVIIHLLWLRFNGSPVAVPQIPRQPQTIGTGTPLTYVVLGDSTSVGQGAAAYARSYVPQSAQHLAQTNAVTWVNLGHSGARARDVAGSQLDQAISHHPDIVLIAVGANDVTHLTDPVAVRDSFTKIITSLRRANPKVAIVITGSPDMGSVPRFAQPLRWYMGLRTRQLNAVLRPFAQDQQVTFAPIADQTGRAFRQDPSLFAADKFHPNNRGYALWAPVITTALDTARAQ